MKVKEFQTKFNNEINKGKFIKATWRSEKVINGISYEKVSNGVVRFVKYANIKGVSVKGKVNPNEQVIIPNTLYYNTNTKTHYVQMATTNIKPQVKYIANGVEISKQDYEMANPPRNGNGNPSPIFRVKLENLLELGNE